MKKCNHSIFFRTHHMTCEMQRSIRKYITHYSIDLCALHGILWTVSSITQIFSEGTYTYIQSLNVKKWMMMIFYKIFRFAALLFCSIKTFLLQRKSICFAFVTLVVRSFFCCVDWLKRGMRYEVHAWSKMCEMFEALI